MQPDRRIIYACDKFLGFMYGIYRVRTYIKSYEYYGNSWISNWYYRNDIYRIHLFIHDGIYMGKFIK